MANDWVGNWGWGITHKALFMRETKFSLPVVRQKEMD